MRIARKCHLTCDERVSHIMQKGYKGGFSQRPGLHCIYDTVSWLSLQHYRSWIGAVATRLLDILTSSFLERHSIRYFQTNVVSYVFWIAVFNVTYGGW